MEKQQIMVFVVYPYSGILLRKKKKENLKNILSEGSKTQKKTHGMILFISISRTANVIYGDRSQINCCFAVCIRRGID